jgi:hypothetical protein
MSNPFSKPQQPAALANPPTVTPPARMPDPNDPAVLEAARRKQMEILGRGGRASTILTGRNGGASSADTYSSPTL